MKRIVRFVPAYDKRHANPNKDYGVHGVDVLFILQGRAGAVQFVLFTNWQLPHVTKEQEDLPCSTRLRLNAPMPADLGYHSPKPLYESQDSFQESCEYTGGKCYYDGSGLAAERIFTILLEKGDEGVWKELEKCYRETFGVPT